MLSLVPSCPIGTDHTFLFFSLKSSILAQPPTAQHAHTIFHFNHDLADAYEHHVQNGLLKLDPTMPIHTLTAQLSQILHSMATSCFPYHTRTATQLNLRACPKTNGMIMCAESSIDAYALKEQEARPHKDRPTNRCIPLHNIRSRPMRRYSNGIPTTCSRVETATAWQRLCMCDVYILLIKYVKLVCVCR